MEDREKMITEIMSYHAPTPETLVKFAAVRAAAIALVMAIDEHCPASADRTAAPTVALGTDGSRTDR